MFASLQQKDISGVLKYLWQSDPFKPKWTVLAKAYSVIRDVRGKKHAPLDAFLAVSAPFVGIIPGSKYLSVLGWEIAVNDEGNRSLMRRFDPDLNTLDSDVVSTEHAVHDIIQHAYEQGYIPADGAEFRVTGQAAAMQNVMVTKGSVRALDEAERPAGRAVANDGHPPDLTPVVVQATFQAPAGNANAESGRHRERSVSRHHRADQHQSYRPESKQRDVSTIRSLIDEAQNNDAREPLQLSPAQALEEYFENRRKEEEIIAAKEHAAVHPESTLAVQPGDELFDQFEMAGTEFPHREHFTRDEDKASTSYNNIGLYFDPFEGDQFQSFNVSEYFDFDMLDHNAV